MLIGSQLRIEVLIHQYEGRFGSANGEPDGAGICVFHQSATVILVAGAPELVNQRGGGVSKGLLPSPRLLQLVRVQAQQRRCAGITQAAPTVGCPLKGNSQSTH